MKFKLLNLFGIPLYKIKINPNSYNKNYYIKIIEKNYFLFKKRNKWDDESNLHHSYGDNDNKQFKSIDWSNIIKLYHEIFNKFCNETLNIKEQFKLSYKINNYTATKKSQYMKAHDHLIGCDFSCVHYIQYSKNSSAIRFLNHNNFANYFRFLRPDLYNLSNNELLENSYIYEKYNFNLEEDDFIIFPSILRHEIPMQKKVDKIRISIVTNLSIEKVK